MGTWPFELLRSKGCLYRWSAPKVIGSWGSYSCVKVLASSCWWFILTSDSFDILSFLRSSKTYWVAIGEDWRLKHCFCYRSIGYFAWVSITKSLFNFSRPLVNLMIFVIFFGERIPLKGFFLVLISWVSEVLSLNWWTIVEWHGFTSTLG